MTILTDWEIRDLCAKDGMIKPLHPNQVKEAQGFRKISYGVSSHGYDVTLGSEVQIFSNLSAAIIDPKRFNPNETLTAAAIQWDNGDGYFILPPHSYALGVTQETFDIPRNIMVICLGKSTYARCGININATPIEAGFKGQVVIEISNTTPLPVRIYIHEGIAQFLFFEGQRCHTSYDDRKGKYQGQKGVTHAKA